MTEGGKEGEERGGGQSPLKEGEMLLLMAGVAPPSVCKEIDRWELFTSFIKRKLQAKPSEQKQASKPSEQARKVSTYL